MACNHDHSKSTKNLGFAFAVNFCFTIIEFIGGAYVNSVAILSDAIHDFGDCLALGTAWYLEKKSHRPADDQYTFGYQRFSIISAFANCIILITGSVIILIEAIGRFLHPEPVNAQGMLYLAILGVVMNGLAALRLKRGDTLNERVMSLHLLEDVLGWTAILIGAVVMMYYPWYGLDALLSLGLCVFIIYNASKGLRASFRILAQAVPEHMDVQDLKRAILQVDGVEEILEMQVWGLNETDTVVTTVVRCSKNDPSAVKKIRNALSPFSIQRINIQVQND